MRFLSPFIFNRSRAQKWRHIHVARWFPPFPDGNYLRRRRSVGDRFDAQLIEYQLGEFHSRMAH